MSKVCADALVGMRLFACFVLCSVAQNPAHVHIDNGLQQRIDGVEVHSHACECHAGGLRRVRSAGPTADGICTAGGQT